MRLRFAILLTVLPLGFFPACREAPPPSEASVRPVKMVTVGGPEAWGKLEFPGELRPARQADMAFEVPGRIVEFPAEEAQVVKAGTVLARLDPRDYQAKLAQVEARVRQAATDVDRYRYLVEQGVNPRRELELKERNLAVLQAERATARKAVEDAVLRAPFDGVVAAKLVEDFVNVQAKQAVLILQDVSKLRITVAVPERDVARMEPGLTLEQRTERVRPRVVVSSIDGRAFPARLQEFATTADPATRTYAFTLEFDQPPDVKLLPGMTAKVVIHSPSPSDSGPSRIAIPAKAVVSDEQGGSFVWRVEPDAMTVHRAPVELGLLAGSEIEVTRGLRSGDTIAVSGVHHLREGMTVRRFEM